MRFFLSCFRFIIKPKEKLVLPAYKGAVLRGGLGWAFKNLVCIRKDKECSNCLISRRCSYFSIFETPVPADATMMRKYPFAPHPFILTPPLNAETNFDNSCELEFELTLIGRAIDYLPYFVYVFDELGRCGLGRPENQYSLVRIEDAADPAGNCLVYEEASKKLSDNFHRIHFSEVQDRSHVPDGAEASPAALLRLLTPTHLVRDGNIDHELKFATVMESLLRRIKLLQYFHCMDRHDGSSPDAIVSAPAEAVQNDGGELTSKEIHRLLSISDQVETMDKRLRWTGNRRKSGHSGAPMTLSGFAGEIEYRFPSQEALEALAPYLRMGEFIHIGKHTSFGFGKIRLGKSGE